MRTPGFTAEASLYQADGHYQMIRQPVGLEGRQAVIPQQRARMRFIDPCWSECWLCELLGLPSYCLQCDTFRATQPPALVEPLLLTR